MNAPQTDTLAREVEPPIVVRYRLTVDDLVLAAEYHFRHNCRPGFRYALYVLFALMIVAGVVALLRRDGVDLGILFLLGSIYWFAFVPLYRRWNIRRQFLKRPDRDVDVEWHVAGDLISIKCSLGQSEVKWAAFQKVVRTPQGIMLYQLERSFHCLPRTGFASDAEFERCFALAKRKIPKHFDVR